MEALENNKGIPDLILWESDLDMNFTYVSESAADLLGYPVSDWLKKPSVWETKIIHQDDQRWVRKFCSAETQKKKTHECRYRAYRADGTMLWLRDKAYILTNKTGQAIGLRGFMMDVTSAVRTEERLKQVEARYRIATTVTRDVIYDWTFATGNIEWTEGVATVFNLPARDMYSDIYSWYEGIHPDDREKVVGSIYSAIDSSSKTWNNEYRYLTGAGAYITVTDRAIIVYDEQNKPLRMIGAMTDITELKRHERERVILLREERKERARAQMALKERDEIIDIMSHDLKNPLSSILMITTLALKKHAPPEEKFVARIRASAEKMKVIIDDVLDMVRTESGRVQFDVVPVDIKKVLADEIAASHDSPTIVMESVAPCLVLADNQKLRHAIARLFRSIFARAEAGSTINVSSQLMGSEVRVSITYRDTHTDKASLLKFFEREGMSMNAAIGQAIIRAHGGNVWIDRHRGSVMTLNFTLPALDQVNQARAA